MVGESQNIIIQLYIILKPWILLLMPKIHPCLYHLWIMPKLQRIRANKLLPAEYRNSATDGGGTPSSPVAWIPNFSESVNRLKVSV
jgi:hypothetical protein